VSASIWVGRKPRRRVALSLEPLRNRLSLRVRPDECPPIIVYVFGAVADGIVAHVLSCDDHWHRLVCARTRCDGVLERQSIVRHRIERWRCVLLVSHESAVVRAETVDRHEYDVPHLDLSLADYICRGHRDTLPFANHFLMTRAYSEQQLGHIWKALRDIF